MLSETEEHFNVPPGLFVNLWFIRECGLSKGMPASASLSRLRAAVEKVD